MTSAAASRGIGRPEPAAQGGSPNIGELSATDTTLAFNGWEKYPQNLATYSSFTQNLSFHSTRLTSRAETLFSTPKDVVIEVLACDIPVSCKIDEMQHDATEETLEKILMEKEQLPFRTFTITQVHSWRELDITESMLRKLFSFLRVFPDFLQVVHLFGRKTEESYSSSSGFSCKIRSSAETSNYSELCFNLFYVERHGRDNIQDPWSLRQTGFYLKFAFKQPSSIHIFIQPSLRVGEVVEEAILNGNISKTNPLPLQLAFLTVAMENWPDYIDFLETELKGFRQCVNLSDNQWNDFRRYGVDKINYSDYRKLQRYFRDKVLRAMSILDSNLDVVLGLQKFNTQLRKQRLIPYDDTFRESCESLEGHRRGIRSLRRSLGSILQVAEGSVKLVQALLDIRNDATIRGYSDATHRLLDAAQDSRKEAVQMVDIAQRTKQDSRTMKIVTVVTMVYLPGTFVATFFGMNIVHSKDPPPSSGPGLMVSNEIWIFVIVTIFLTGVTIGLWWITERHGSREQTQLQAEKETPTSPRPLFSAATTLQSPEP